MPGTIREPDESRRDDRNVPNGMIDDMETVRRPFSRPGGTCADAATTPGVETPGYCRVVPLGRTKAAIDRWMHDATDMDLLRQYADWNSDSAFTFPRIV